jgi:glycosyltransferase involved in cell wall biosynthesis
MKLSILIATIHERKEQFDMLYDHLHLQSTSEVEILSLADNKEISIGMKRQRLLEMGKGDYVVFIDDDDWVADNYIPAILAACTYHPDCIGFKINCSINGETKSAIASLRYRTWGDQIDGFDYVRSIYHKTPVKRTLALQIGFKDQRYGEDHDYSKRLQPLLHTEQFIDQVLYYYRYSNAVPHNIKYGING